VRSPFWFAGRQFPHHPLFTQQALVMEPDVVSKSCWFIRLG
jgi:hypothetical protein